MGIMQQIEKFAMGGLLAAFAVIALYVAARGEGAAYIGGIAFFVICIGLIFYQIAGVRFGEEEKKH
jgi:hypothetical protein